ncbi:MAG: (2Fe-2S)-binding protein [Burkholderiales bacterium]
MKQVVQLNVNDAEHELALDPSRTLLEVLRESLGLTGTKEVCLLGSCGACTVLVDDRPVLACLTLASACQGKRVLTIEGLRQGEALHPLQQAFIDKGAVQCGFCTPGMIMAGKALLDRNPHPTPDEARAAIAGNLCRCTGYEQIVEAIVAAPAVDEAVRVGAREGGHYLMPDMAE